MVLKYKQFLEANGEAEDYKKKITKGLENKKDKVKDNYNKTKQQDNSEIDKIANDLENTRTEIKKKQVDVEAKNDYVEEIIKDPNLIKNQENQDEVKDTKDDLEKDIVGYDKLSKDISKQKDELEKKKKELDE